MRDLAKSLNELCDSAEFEVSWYLKDLASGATANRRGDVAVPSASTRKISIMMAALAAVHAGKLSLDQKITIDSRFQDNDSGTFQHLTPGFWLTLRDAMVMMIIVSDNTCTGHVADVVGLSNIQRYTEAVGLTGTVHRYGIPPKTGPDNTLDRVTITTANDQGLLLEMILKGTKDPAVAAKLRVHDRALPARARHPVVAEAQDAAAVAPAARHEGRPQDRDRPPLLQRRRHHLQGRPPALHPDGVYGGRARCDQGRDAGLRRGLPADRADGADVLRRARRLAS